MGQHGWPTHRRLPGSVAQYGQRKAPGSGKFTGIRKKSLPLNLIFNNLQVDSGLLFYGGNAACRVRNALPIESFLDAAGRRGQPCFDEKVSVSQQRPIS
jgi:hypothetical protein